MKLSLSFRNGILRLPQDDDVFRRGRRTSSPPQLGQTLFISCEQFSQKVHSYEQM
jgi:hypothetical protein